MRELAHDPERYRGVPARSISAAPMDPAFVKPSY
jgi:hypothetical protein